MALITNGIRVVGVYTERYMNTPAKNQAGYESSAIAKMNGFSHAAFLLAHGSGDDNGGL